MKKHIIRGFTLIELLVVIAVIALLASIILVSLNSARLKGKDTRIISDLGQLRDQLEADANPSGIYQDYYSSPGIITVADLTNNPGNTTGQSTYCSTAQGSSPSVTPCSNLLKLYTDIVNNQPTANNVLRIYYRTTSVICGASANNINCPNMIQYALVGQMNSGNFFCVSSDGNSTTFKSASLLSTANSPDCSTFSANG